MEYRVSSSERVFEGKVFNVRIDQVERPGGGSVRVDIVEHVGAVVMLPVDERDDIWFVRQYRHAIGQWLLELPAGTLEPGEDAETCARRECREEIGREPGRLEALGGFHLAPGYSTEYIRAFLATDLRPARQPADEDEDLHIERIPRLQVEQLARSGELHDAKSLAALYLAGIHRPP